MAVHTCSSRVYFTFTSVTAGAGSMTFYSQLSMMKHNSANFSRQKNAKTDLPTPMLALSMYLMPPDVTRTTRAASRARIIQGPDDLSARYVMPSDEAKKRKEDARYMVARLKEFRKNWGIFTEGSLILTPRIISR